MASSVELRRVEMAVRKYLEKDIRTRDNDALLCARIWFDELRGANLTAKEFLAEYSHGTKFTNSESIRRSRQKIQQHNVELRGSMYAKRKFKETLFHNQLNNSSDEHKSEHDQTRASL